jgi:hypothetical protein
MKRISLLLTLSLLAFAPLPRADAKSYGAGVTLAETTSLAKILADPDAYVGKKVRIEGRVADVCPMKGCWMELSEEKAGSKLRVKVDDGVIVFPVTAKGKLAVAEGVVEAIPMTRERYVAWLEHLAEERGQKLDPATVGSGPFRILQIRGTGARIAE